MAIVNNQSYRLELVRASLILTTSYVAGTVLNDVENFNQLMLFYEWTKGSLTSLEIKVEFSFDGQTYSREIFSSVSGGTSTDSLGEHTTTDAGNGLIAIPIKCSKIRISVKGTGTVTNSLLVVNAVVAVT